ncbi:flagellar hook assembly protein FlgD [Antarcticimicrobium luteum]|uniref:Basal-body rod modification protein FlgD n=1 Tax=Antarcticimicrobium luteum TaxID=2547397 RepID=A0A4V3ASE6_9RHOB|nr:flagellar hook assembly protein FlgD [Antarcticimicrobium luteum]TDK50218.1 flagellar hook assembly protein FlgD [Antarcticimicrobium luteum]
MDVTATGSTQTTGSSNSSLSQLGEDYTRFLTLLTAQIQYQDPLAPMDSTQFVSQLAQLSQVEQAVKSNTNLETLSAQFGALTSVAGAGMIGRDVTVSSDQVLLDNGMNDGYYMLTGEAAEVSAQIVDPLDRVVRELNGLATTPGELLPLQWDGKDDLGADVLSGSYSVRITAVDGAGDPVAAYTYRKTSVKEVLFAEGTLYYGLPGDENVPAASILAVR